jgi:maltooligosyltrehalose synthase
MANFLAKALSDVIEKKELKLEGEEEDDRAIVKFLDHLFDLLPTTVSKCWTKFSQYF